MQPSGLLGTVLGGLKSEKMQTVQRENHFFESRLLGLSDLHLALLGSSWPLPGPSWGPDGSQNGPKREFKMGPKMGPKLGPFLGCSQAHFGAHFGSKTEWLHPPFLDDFFQKLQFRVRHSSIFDI